MTSTTIEAQIDDIFEEYGLGNTTLASEKGIVAARSKLLKAIEAEKLKGQIGELKRYERNWSNRTDFADLDYMNKRLQSLQQQLDSMEEK